MWSQQALGLDPIREERTSSEASSGRRSLHVTLQSPIDDTNDLFWLADGRRRSIGFQPVYFDPAAANDVRDGAAPLHQRRSLDVHLAEKPQRRASFDVDRRLSCDVQHKGGIRDPAAAAAAAVSQAVQARVSFESARASFDMPPARGVDGYTGRRSCSDAARAPYVRRDWYTVASDG